ncbi:MAG: hypothetical protein OHK0046_20260 [Anaerolineae bacterium]
MDGFKNLHYNLYWHDETILVVEVRDQWTWDDVTLWTQALKRMIRSVEHPVYVVIHFMNDAAAVMPRSTSVFSNLKYMMLSAALPQERMVVMVNPNKLMRGFMSILARAYDLQRVFDKYTFTATFDEALVRIQHAKAHEGIQLDEEVTLVLMRNFR